MSIKSKNIRRSLRKYGTGGSVPSTLSQPSTSSSSSFSSDIPLIGSIIGMGTSAGNSMKQDAISNDKVDVQGYATGNAVSGFFDPFSAGMDAYNKEGLTWDTALAFTGVGGYFTGENDAKQIQKDMRLKKYAQTSQQTAGMSRNNSTPLMPYGGRVDSNTVELEQGEPYMTPDGQIQSIPTSAPTHAQGGVPITLPVGTKVLGKKTAFDKKQFKQLGRQLEKAQKKYDKELDNNPTSVGAQTARKMLNNIQKNYNSLFQDQGVDTSNSNTQYGEGGSIQVNDPNQILSTASRPYTDKTVYRQYSHPDTNKSYYVVKPTDNNKINPNVFKLDNNTYATYEPYSEAGNKWNIDYAPSIQRTYADNKEVKYFNPNQKYGKGGEIKIDPKNKGKFNALKKRTGKSTEELTHSSNPLTRKRAVFAQNAKKWKHADGGLIKYADGGVLGKDYFNQNPDKLRDFQYMYGLNTDNIYGPKTEAAWNTYGQDYINNGQLNKINPKSGLINNPNATTVPTQTSVNNSIPVSSKTSNTNFNLQSTANTIGTVAPIAYNLYQGTQKAEQLNPNEYYNPYINDIRKTLSNRTYNVNPEISNLNSDTASYYRQLREGAMSPAQLVGGMQEGLVNKTKTMSNILAQKQNIDNGYLSEKARMDAELGQGMAATKLNIKDVNDRNNTARRNYTNAAMSQLSQYAQVKQQENNQMIRDAQKLNLLPTLVQNFSLTPEGDWVLKSTGQKMSKEQIMSYITGNNLR